jgi:hypothetical protein
MKPYDYQMELSKQAYHILGANGVVYLSMLERTGKTLTSILVADMSMAQSVLVLTKKKALDGWDDTLKAYKPQKKYTLTNYHSAHKVVGKFDLVILDEAHVMAAYPKPGKIWKNVFRLTHNLPIIYLSATPYAETIGQLYNQFKLTKYSPFRKWKSYYDFHRAFGISDKIRTPYGLVDTYKKFRTQEVLDLCEHLFISKTRQELGFEHEPEDVVHTYGQSPEVSEIVKDVTKTEMLRIGNIEEPLDSPMKLRVTIYQIEGGWVKYENECLRMPKLDRIEAIKKYFGTGKDCAIMAHFNCEQDNLSKYFPDAVILSSNAHAEGVDLSHIPNLIIYSMDFSTARAFQRRARQANKNRKEPIKVHFYHAKGSMSEEVYNTVFKKKENFLKDSYERWKEKI